MVKVRYNPFAIERHELFSRLTADQCVLRLKEHLNSPRHVLSREPSREGVVYGRVYQRGLTLRKVLRRGDDVFSWRVSFHVCQTVASGQLIPESGGTRILVSLGVSRFGAIALTLSAAAVAFGAFVFAVLSLVSATALLGLVACLGTLAVASVIYVYLCQMASGARGRQDENQFFLDFLLRTLSAEEVVRH